MSETTRDRAKKKKKAKSKKGLIVGLSAGGAVLVVGVVALIVVLGNKGDAPKKSAEVPAKVDPVGYVRPMKQEDAIAKLGQIGLAYHAYVDAHAKGPKDQRELDPFLKDPELIKMVDGAGAWVDLMVNWMPRNLPEGSSKTIVAYERKPFEGKRVVLFGDAKASLLTEAEFDKAPRVSPEGKIVAGPLVREGGKTRLGKYVRALSRIETELTLDKVGKCYVAFEILNNRGPKELSELDCARDALVIGSLNSKDGWLHVIWGAGRREMPAGPERTIIAYERESDGSRYVIFGNGTFAVLTDEEFAKAPRAKWK